MYKRKVPLLGLVAILVLTMSAFKCDKYKTAAATSRDLAAGLVAFQKEVVVMQKAGKISIEEDRALQQYVVKAADAGTKLDQDIRVAKDAKGAKADYSVVMQAIHDLNDAGLSGVKNPDSQAELRLALSGIEGLANSLFAAQ